MAKNLDPNYPKLTPGEHAKVAYYVARMAKRSLASETVHMADLERKVDRILKRAHERAAREEMKRK